MSFHNFFQQINLPVEKNAHKKDYGFSRQQTLFVTSNILYYQEFQHIFLQQQYRTQGFHTFGHHCISFIAKVALFHLVAKSMESFYSVVLLKKDDSVKTSNNKKIYCLPPTRVRYTYFVDNPYLIISLEWLQIIPVNYVGQCPSIPKIIPVFTRQCEVRAVLGKPHALIIDRPSSSC